MWFESIAIELSSHDNVPDGQTYSFDVKTNTFKNEDALTFKVHLIFHMAPADEAVCRYDKINFEVVGIFDLPDDTDMSVVQQLVPANCLAMLHGFARGVIAQITGLNPGGPIMLPSVNFVEVLDKEQQLLAQSEASE